jgi:hypothetical protein
MSKRTQRLRDEALFWCSLALIAMMIPMNWTNLVPHPAALAEVIALDATAFGILIWQRYA